MPKAEELQKAITELRVKSAEAAKGGKPAAELRALHKQVKRAQRKLRLVTGKKLAAIRKKHGGEEAAAAPAAAPAGGDKK